MSEELIRRSDAIDIIEITPFEDYGDYIKAREIIENLPTIEAVPKDFHDKTCEAMAKRHTEEIQRLMPKRGEWEEKETFSVVDDNPIIEQWQSARCSMCERYHTTPYMYYFNDYNYCPYCGARMKGAEDEG